MKKSIIIYLAIALLALSCGYFLGQSRLSFGQGSKSQNKPVASLDSNVKINSLSGAVKSINGSMITLKINESDERIVEVDSQAKIYVQEQKDPAQYQKEMDEYLKKIQENSSNQLKLPDATAALISSDLSPEVFTKKPGSLNDIKSGNTITVVSNQDIKEVKQFKAAQVIIPPPSSVGDVAK